MNWLDLPPLAALRAFSAFAQSGNVTLAGAALNVSHAAISQHLRALEAHLGVSLLDRSGRALSLTVEGDQLARALDLGFGAIGAAVQDLKGADANRPLHISCTSSFAASWLMPRLPGFRALHPEINLMLDPSPELVTLKPGGIDLAIRYGQGDWPGHAVEMLLASPMVIVAAPGLLKTKGEITPAELANYPWLDELGTTESTNWAESYGVQPSKLASRVQVPGNLLLDGVRSGQGVVVTVRHFVEDDLKSGRLVELFCEADNRGYHIVTRPGVLRPSARKFVQWLRRQ
ncbi:LysR family transcriptional regulator [Parasedimentitalea psychrophila]|uniref:LysR family transcriptional regulator n=1 Tax=Parasedimentitalea psychrophila TaxID=2997337 RepID=A0A9Y2P8S3_9RHOB|nr:LysR family transcriptional regulator [Parasedimentitalea psychrophila]WIY27210.1 LysR family transcriptional regulator [Parasedimentitalea psychrophila]